jgi:hypothetical protein
VEQSDPGSQYETGMSSVARMSEGTIAKEYPPIIASAAKQSTPPLAALWIASLRSNDVEAARLKLNSLAEMAYFFFGGFSRRKRSRSGCTE